MPPPPSEARARGHSYREQDRVHIFGRGVGVPAIRESASQELARGQFEAPSGPLRIPLFVERLPSRCSSLPLVFLPFGAGFFFFWEINFDE